MKDPIGSGPLHDLHYVGQRHYYDSKRRGEDTSGALMFMGAATVAIGCKMLWEGFKKTRAGREARGQGRGR